MIKGILRCVIKKIKDGKAIGVDEISGKVWKYGEEKLLDWIIEFCKDIKREWMIERMKKRSNNPDREKR